MNRARRHYWSYVSRHPVHFPTPEGALRDAVDAIVWYFVSDLLTNTAHGLRAILQTDNLMTGSNSIVPFSKAECEELLRLLKYTDSKRPLEGAFFLLIHVVYSGSSPSKTVFLAWILKEVCEYNT